MDLSSVKESLPRTRVLRGMLLGVMVALGLAAAYVHKGMELLGNGQFTTIDGYAFLIAILVGSLVSVSYLIYFRDISEAVAIESTLLWSLFFGLEDVFVYLLLPDTSIPETLPWLADSPVGFVSGILGFAEVSRTSLYLTILLTGIILFFVVKILDNFETEFLDLQV